MIRIGHWQLQCQPGDFQGSLAKVIKGLEEADRRHLAIVSFPESFLTGYYDTDEGFRAPGHNFPLQSPQVVELLSKTARFNATFMVGFNELSDGKIYQSVLVAERGKLLGVYRKAFPCSPWETPGRDFPVFERDGVKFGIVICADGGYIEPTRILALKGARLIFAPHYNYIPAQGLISHFMKVRSDHIARAVENGIWFFRGCNVVDGLDPCLSYEGVGYGDSYIIDPLGEIVVRSRRHVECLVETEIDVAACGNYGIRRSVVSGKELGDILLETLAQTANPPM